MRLRAVPSANTAGELLPQAQAAPESGSSLAAFRRSHFWLIAYVFAVTMLSTTWPTPLYVVYEAQHFVTT